jgi:soluble lytic murein transglycosylase-like protein
MRLSRFACLLLPAFFIGFSGCDPSDSSSAPSTAGFDPTAPQNRPDPVRFGQRQEPQLSPEAKSLLDRTQSTTAGALAASDPTAQANKWGAFFDGSAQKAPLDESKIGAVMAREGVSSPIVNTVLAQSRQQGADPLLVFSVMKQESHFKAGETSPAGARGLMQIMPDTGRGLGVSNPAQLYNPQVNIQAGVHYLKTVFNQFSDVSMGQLSNINPFADNSVKSAIAAYNAGSGAVEKYHGVPPFSETRDYVQKVLSNYADFRRRLTSV